MDDRVQTIYNFLNVFFWILIVGGFIALFCGLLDITDRDTKFQAFVEFVTFGSAVLNAVLCKAIAICVKAAGTYLKDREDSLQYEEDTD